MGDAKHWTLRSKGRRAMGHIVKCQMEQSDGRCPRGRRQRSMMAMTIRDGDREESVPE